MRHGVFSVTKSLGAALALLRLAQKYGDAVPDVGPDGTPEPCGSSR
jgi:hypothetical protein